MADRRVQEAELVAEFWEALRSFLRKSELVARKHGRTPQRQQLLVMIAGSRNGSSTITALSARLSLAQKHCGSAQFHVQDRPGQSTQLQTALYIDRAAIDRLAIHGRVSNIELAARVNSQFTMKTVKWGLLPGRV